MGKFKNFFVEEVDEPQVTYDESYVDEDVDVDVNTDNVTQENLISDIYNQNDLSDLSKSIFKIEDVINSLPKEMPNETKKGTVLSVLSTFGLTVDEVIADGEDRSLIIKSALSSITDENNDVINSNNASIEQKKLEIQELEKDNSDRAIVIKNAEDKVEAELKRIDDLIKFIGGNA
jgi:hypothetical protein